MNKQGTAGKRTHGTLTIAQKCEIITRLESGENWREVMASYSIGLSTICDIKNKKDKLWKLMVSSESVKGLFEWQMLKDLSMGAGTTNYF